MSGSRIGICTSVRGLRNGFGGVHGGGAGVRVGGGEEGREVLLRRDIKWGGIICLVVREGRGYYLVLVEGLGLVIRAEATSVLGLRVIGGGGGVGFRVVQIHQLGRRRHFVRWAKRGGWLTMRRMRCWSRSSSLSRSRTLRCAGT